jgi:hypothetical protein
MAFDGTVVLALAFVCDSYVCTTGLASIAVGLSIDATDGSVDLRTTASFADASLLRRSQNAFLASPADRTVVVVLAERVLRDALTQLTDVARRAIDEGTEIDADAGRRRLREVWLNHAIIGPSSKTLAVVARRAVAVVQALAWMRFRQDLALNLEIAKRRHHDEALEPNLLSIAQKQAFTEVLLLEDRWVEQLEARSKRLAEAHHLMR